MDDSHVRRQEQMIRDALFLTGPPNGQPAALLRSDALAPLIVFGDWLVAGLCKGSMAGALSLAHTWAASSTQLAFTSAKLS